MNSKFIENRIVKKEHIDQLNHVNNVQYLQWAQEIAKSHWNHLIATLDEPLGVWMVRSHQVEYRLNAAKGENIKIETHVSSVRGPLSNRVVEFYSDLPKTFGSMPNTVVLYNLKIEVWCRLLNPLKNYF